MLASPKPFYLALPLCCLAPLFAQPVVPFGGVVNSASYSPVGLPNSNIAQGSIFSVFGSALSGAPQSSVGFPLPTNLGGTSVSVTSGGITAPAFLFYSSSTQLDALLPSNLPIGSAALTVSYNSQTSVPVTFDIVTSSFGIFTANAQGTGYGIITNIQYQVFSSITAAEAGDVVTLWGTGLGPVSGDESAGPLPGNLSSVPVQVWVGLQPAAITYQGRSGCCAGLDQIAFAVPSGVTGCAIPIAVQIGAVTSNFAYIPIGDGSRVCSTPGILSVSDFLNQLQTENRYNAGDVFLTHHESIGTSSSAASSFDAAYAAFYSDPSPIISTFVPEVDDPPLGICNIYPYYSGTIASTATPLDAGTALTVSGPAGLVQLPQVNPGGYASSQLTNPSFLTPGASYTVTGPGGVSVGPFTSTVSIPQQFQWTNQDVTSISQSQGLQVSWSGADPADTIRIIGDTILSSPFAGAEFDCRVPASDGQFTVPPFVLYSLPISSPQGASTPLGELTLQEESGPTVFSATGLDLAYSLGALSITSNNVTYGP